MSFDGISTDAYLRRRSACQLDTWIRDICSTMTLADPSEGNFLQRRGRHVKELAEEAIPVSRLALHLLGPSAEVFVRLALGEPDHDAEIEIEGVQPTSFKVEVTSSENHESALRRELIARQGFAVLSGTISRINGRIETEPEMVRVSEYEDRLEQRLLDLLREKLDGRYDSDTTILINQSELWRPTFSLRDRVARRALDALAQSSHQVRGAVFYHQAVNALDFVSL